MLRELKRSAFVQDLWNRAARFDRKALEDLKQYARKHRITLTGEGGEYETLVLDAPLFTRRIVIEESTEEYCNYRGILRVRRASLEAK